MDRIELRHYLNRFWMVAEVYKNTHKIADINKFYEVDKDWILVFDCIGGSGTGHRKGELIQKIFIGNAEFEKIEINE